MSTLEKCLFSIILTIGLGGAFLGWNNYMRSSEIQDLREQVTEMREELTFMREHAKWVEKKGKEGSVVWWPF